MAGRSDGHIRQLLPAKRHSGDHRRHPQLCRRALLCRRWPGWRRDSPRPEYGAPLHQLSKAVRLTHWCSSQPAVSLSSQHTRVQYLDGSFYVLLWPTKATLRFADDADAGSWVLLKPASNALNAPVKCGRAPAIAATASMMGRFVGVPRATSVFIPLCLVYRDRQTRQQPHGRPPAPYDNSDRPCH